MKNVLAVALVVFVASIALSQAPAPAPRTADAEKAKAATADQNSRPLRRPENYQKCEYKVLNLVERDEAAVERALNELAKEGYELERVVADRIGIMRRQYRSVLDRGLVQPGTGPSS